MRPELQSPDGALAAAIETERYDRFGLDQAQLRISCNVILSAIRRLDIRDIAVVISALSKYPQAEWHADREPFRVYPTPPPASRTSARGNGEAG